MKYINPDGRAKPEFTWSGNSNPAGRAPEMNAFAPSSSIFRCIGSIASLAVTGGASLVVQGVGMVIGGLFLEPIMLVANIIYRVEEAGIDDNDPDAKYKRGRAVDRIKGTKPGQGVKIGFLLPRIFLDR